VDTFSIRISTKFWAAALQAGNRIRKNSLTYR